MRSHLDLDGAWQFYLDTAGNVKLDDISDWHTIHVPAPWQTDLHTAPGVGWYRRQIPVPTTWAEKSVFICFGAVDYFAEVWVNGHAAGTHEGGYLPFELNITALLNFGEDNEIVVRVVDPSKESDIFPDFPFAEIPHGKQSWYGPIGGIWQSVYLEARSPHFVGQIHVTPQNLTGDVSVKIQASGDRFHLRCFSADGQVVSDFQADTGDIHFTIPQPRLWELDSPHLYTLEVELLVGETVVDRQQVRFGIRTFEARDGRLWLNGKLFYMRGALDQDYYPDGIYTPPSLEFLREQVRLAKSMGLNTLRCHIKIADPRYLQAADEEGMLIWAEVPSWGKLTEKSGQRARDTFAGMVARDWNHPSIVIWTIVNEDWGTDLPGSAADRQWLHDTFQWAKQIDPHRLIVDNSPCPPNFHMHSDLDDFHFYAAMPEGVERWQNFVTQFASRAEWTYSPHDDSTRTGNEPLIVSEFGNWGLPDIERLKAAYQGEPWWFETGRGWIPDVVHPAGVEQRFQDIGLHRVFESLSELAKAAQWAEYRALKHEIETMRAEAAISGYIITEWTDLHWECNGLVDMARNPRVFADKFADINADTVIVPRWTRLAFQSGEKISVDLLISHFGTLPLENVTLTWSLENISGELSPVTLLPGEVIHAGTVIFDAPMVSEPQRLTLHFELANIARNSLSIVVLPELPPQSDIRVVSHLNEETLHFIREGGHVLACLTEPGTVLEGITVEARAGTPWSGDWASSFAWIRPEMTRMPTDGLLDFTWSGVLPKHVIRGVKPEETFAGLFVGWLHIPVALIAQLQIGKGWLTLTTFPILSGQETPVRDLLFQDLMRLAGSPVPV